MTKMQPAKLRFALVFVFAASQKQKSNFSWMRATLQQAGRWGKTTGESARTGMGSFASTVRRQGAITSGPRCSPLEPGILGREEPLSATRELSGSRT